MTSDGWLGFTVASDKIHVHDLQATILHQLGIDHARQLFLRVLVVPLLVEDQVALADVRGGDALTGRRRPGPNHLAQRQHLGRPFLHQG